MVFNWFKPKAKEPKKSLVIFGTDFGSYQLLQLVQSSSKYQVAGFISTDSWQRRSGFGKIGVILPDELNAICGTQKVAGILVTSDQKELLENDVDMDAVRKHPDLIRFCEVLDIPQASSATVADAFIDSLI